MVSQRMRDYELVMVISPEVDEDDATAAIQRVADFITERGGTVSEPDAWGVRRLAFPIRRYQEGNFVLRRFAMDAKDVVELDRTLIASEDVLTHLVTKVEKSAG